MIQAGLVGMVQHIHHMGTADALRIVQTGILIAASVQIFDTFLRHGLHVFFRTELNRTGRTSLHAGRLLTDGDTVGTQRAFVSAVVFFVETRNIERTTCDAVSAANTVFLMEINNTVLILDNRPWRRTGFQTARVGTVHTAVFADEPFQLAVFLGFGKPHNRPTFRRQVDGVVVYAVIGADFVADVVPFRTGHLTGLAADAATDVDEFRHFNRFAHARRRGNGRGGGTALDVQRL